MKQQSGMLCPCFEQNADVLVRGSRLGVTNGEKIIKTKALERLKGDSESTEQRKKVTVSPSNVLLCISASYGCLLINHAGTEWREGEEWSPCLNFPRVPELSSSAHAAQQPASGAGWDHLSGTVARADGVWQAEHQQGSGGLLPGPVPAGARQEHRCGAL